jgi:hypothetical protein
MATVTLPSGKIPPLVEDLGRLTGLFDPVATDLEFDFGWFGNPLAELAQIPSAARRPALLKLVGDLLGVPAPVSPDDGRQWCLVSWAASQAPLYVVLPAQGAGVDAPIGVGLFHDFTKTAFEAQASLFVPVTSGSAPIEILLTIRGVKPPGPVSFDGIQLKATLPGSATPGFTLAFHNAQPAQAITDTLAALRSGSVPGLINALLEVPDVTAWLDQAIGKNEAAGAVTVGTLLVALGILQKGDNGYTLGVLDDLVSMTPEQIAGQLLKIGLDTLAQLRQPILAVGAGGISVIATKAAGATDYALRVAVPDIDLSSSGGPAITLQLGKGFDGETATDTWMLRSDPAGTFPDPGVTIRLVSFAGATPSFAPRVDLVDVGLDVTGAGGKPLVSVNGVTLDGIQPRILLSLDLSDSTTQLAWGAALRIAKLGIALASGLSGANANPVAQNILSAGSSASSGDKEPVNPAFSAVIGRVFEPNGALDVRLEQDGGSARTIWIPVQRAFGPLQCRRVGVSWPEDNPDLRLDFLFDGGVRLSALAVDLEGLTLGIPLKTPGQIESYALDLQGMGLAYDAGELAITGGFLKDATATPVEYNGAAVFQTAKWSLSALGSYASLDGHPSLFVFVRLGGELGGPPFFFVTGLCAGFGYNRSLKIPNQDEVPKFPLLAGIADPTQIGGADATPLKALSALSAWVAPAQGEDWVAAGLQLTSFELVQSNAVATVMFGKDFQVALLGVSRMKLGQTGPQFAYAELGLSLVIHPAAGFFGVSAVLSPNSYVLTPDCHLTGGFAFWTWYSGEHAGDFVYTLGGYHPAFAKPDWYPDEARLGFTWQVDSNVTIQGDAYFALTPSCAMGGGALDVELHDGDLHAWFTAHADFLFTWKPFYFIGDVGVSVGASYKIDLLFFSITVSVELGADLDIWGPPTGGRVHISWFIISFSIGFGADEKGPSESLSWSDFKTLIPQQAAPEARPAMAAAVDDDKLPPDVITIAIAEGLVRTEKATGRWLVRGDTMLFSVSTTFPLTKATLAGATAASYAPDAPDDVLALRPMGIAGITSVLTITVTDKEGSTMDLGGTWLWTPALQGVPAAMWGPPLPSGSSQPDTPSADTLPGRLVGIGGLTPRSTTPSGPDPIPLENLAVAALDKGDSDWLPLSMTAAPVQRQPKADPKSTQTIATTIATMAGVRTDLFAALAALGYDAGTNGDVQEIAANASLGFPDAPMLGAPWQEAA